MTDFYFHVQTKLVVMLLDDECMTMWEDRDKHFDSIEVYRPIHDVVNDRTLLVEHDDFEEDFFLMDDDFFDDWQLYELDLDELKVYKLKKIISEIMEKQNQLKR